ncbi:glycosyltransferase family A protein [Rathayibacter toxicus]|uniref:Glycosyltransferase family 2 protein n=1 Tax=Rathayibacter toxicus TaxID=145458 RepID=A0A2S5Y819_9MICO|nr:glycosyltransferase family A protein [Rathayibacter toxicus]PPH24447.1 glycosyltransferase family 2 protein [Rathayibacter toxicus]PPH57944.1 glycosyltransferase family 2 protein [Rathayibacter toxicus]PPH60422.1 glycosyltransferase family 2 protein [Rathayibacter toxicus]PPH88113.1 glycosyltransferase family 2 protein [Rathayibacter toxicus]PPI15772.1 glycosyltransferase family 2 protein [Rathayibacter toxicus]
MTSRRWSGVWGTAPTLEPPQVDVLVPTAGRRTELAVTLAGLAAQDDPRFRVIVSDQSDDAVTERDPTVLAMLRVLAAQGRAPLVRRNLPRRGLAQQRQYLLSLSSAPAVLFLDDDVWLEPGTLARMHDALDRLDCGFVGSAVQGLSHLNDVRPHEQGYELWGERATPERIRRGTAQFERWRLHNAANLTHVAAGLELAEGEWRAYRIAWLGACVLYRRDALVASGGFDFWTQLPPEHSGEDVAAQWRVMERFGGAGLLPSGAVHLETPTTVTDRNIDAFDRLFAEEHRQ